MALDYINTMFPVVNDFQYVMPPGTVRHFVLPLL